MMQYWIAAGIAIVLAVMALVLRSVMHRNRKWSHSVFAHIVFVALMWGLVFVLRHTANMLLAEYKIQAISTDIVNTVALLAIVLVALQQLDQLINRFVHAEIRKGRDPTSARLVARVLKLSLIMFAVLMFGEHFGVGLSGILAFGGIGGIAIGMAGKDILSNMFSGIMLYFDRPFNIGDWISSPDRNIEGTVVEIGWRITEIKTFDNRPLYVPNAVFSSISVENPGRMTNRRIDAVIGLRYEDADKIAAVIEAIRTMLKHNNNIDQTQTTLINFNGFADSSLSIMVYCFTKTVKWAEWLDIQQDIYLKIIEIVHAQDADFAFPTQTLYMEKPDMAPEDLVNPVKIGVK